MSQSPERAGARQWVALAVVTLAVVLLAIDNTVLALAVPALTAAIDPSATQLLWIGDIYSFALAGLLITMGNLADRIGRKRLLLIGAAGFGAASALAAFSPSPETLIAARALLGVFGATLMPATLSIIRDVFVDPAQRTKAIAVWSAGASGGAAAGPLVGGLLLEHFWWGAVFLINVPIMLVLIIAGFFVIPESRSEQPRRIDLLSAVLSFLALVPAVYAVKTLLGQGFGLSTVAGLAISVIAGLWFISRQRRLAEPMMDLELFKRPAFSGAIIANGIAIFAFSGLLFFFSQYLQFVRGYSPLLAGVAELPLTLASILVIFVIARLSRRLGQGPAIATGLLLAAIGLIGLAVAEGLPGYAWIGLALIPIGLGIGITMTLSTDAVVSSAPKDRAGAASSIAETSYELGIALGIAILGSLQTLAYRGTLDVPAGTDPGLAETVRESLGAATRALRDAPGSELLSHARESFTIAMQITSASAAVLMLLAALLAWRLIPAAGKAERPERQD